MSIFEQIKLLFNQPDLDEVIAFQYKLPQSITVNIRKEGGYLIAKVEKIDGKGLEDATVMTEAKTVVELVAEVNDMLLEYLDFPDNIKPRMPQLLPPEIAEKELQRLKSTSRKELVFAK